MDKETFKNIVDSYPNLSSYICFARLVKEKDWKKEKIWRLFNLLVDKEDYESDQKRLLIFQLTEYSKKSPK